MAVSYYGDLNLGDTIDIKFATVNTSGAPTTLAGTPAVSAYVDNDLVELTAGITLTVDFDGRTGLNNVRVVATGGNGYAAGKNYELVITAGTVGGTSVVGYPVGAFSIQKRLDQAGVRTAVGLGSANLDTQLATIDDFLDTEIAAILAAVDTEVAAIKAKTDNLPEGITKNAVLNNFEFFMVDAADHVTGKTGLTVTAERSIDGGAFGAAANAVVEVGVGVYKINLAASDTNGDVITYKFTAAGADATLITVKTEVS